MTTSGTRTQIEDATFLNGMATHPDGRVLAVDSRNGTIYAIDPNHRHWTHWVHSTELAPETAASDRA